VLALAGARQALADSVAYLRERSTFGEPLATRQALRHRVADLAAELEAARQLVYHAARLHADGDPCLAEVSMAKLYATEIANRVAYQAVQLHGGYGYMREFAVERFFRDVRLWTIASGTSEVMREIIAKTTFDKEGS
jgi:alkylation response protein AidB-like acyl-CoA dehydrogenase